MNGGVSPSRSSSNPLLNRMMQQQQRDQRTSSREFVPSELSEGSTQTGHLSIASLSEEISTTSTDFFSIMGNEDSKTIIGPSELYHLICAATWGIAVGWEVVLQRARTHPHEACFYDPDKGGHVYALHRLLWRRVDDEESSGRKGRLRPPVAVVEAVMRACPRAVTRKQAVIDEDDNLMMNGAAGAGGSDNNNNGMDWQGTQQMQQQQVGIPALQNMHLDIPPGAVGADHEMQGQEQPNENIAAQPANNNDDGDDQSDEDEEEDPPDGDDVRFEYPLAIACECEQDGEVVRLLASYLSKAKPVYRSEVFRSLDYASLSNSIVRILLEEYAGCVLERGMNSEATEGDDDDCPLEQVLFWWDDPDMLGMEEGERAWGETYDYFYTFAEMHVLF